MLVYTISVSSINVCWTFYNQNTCCYNFFWPLELERKKKGMLFQTQKGTAHLPIFFPDLAKILENPKTCPDFETHLEPCTNVSR